MQTATDGTRSDDELWAITEKALSEDRNLIPQEEATRDELERINKLACALADELVIEPWGNA